MELQISAPVTATPHPASATAVALASLSPQTEEGVACEFARTLNPRWQRVI